MTDHVLVYSSVMVESPARARDRDRVRDRARDRVRDREKARTRDRARDRAREGAKKRPKKAPAGHPTSAYSSFRKKEDFRRNVADLVGVLSLDDLMLWTACPTPPPPPGLQCGKI